MFWGRPRQPGVAGVAGVTGGASVCSAGSALPVIPRAGAKRSRGRGAGGAGGSQLTDLSTSQTGFSSSLSTAASSAEGLSWTESSVGPSSATDMTRLSSVLLTLVTIIRKQLMQPPQRPLFVPPKHLGYDSLDKTKKGGGPKKFYPQSVCVEDTEKYLLHTEMKETEDADNKGKKIVLGKMQTASADKQRYAFDRTSGNYILNAMEEEKNAKLEKVRKLEESVETEEQVVALRSEGLWIKQQSSSMDHRVKRLEHLLHVLEREQKLEIRREMDILKAGDGAKGMHAAETSSSYHGQGAKSSTHSASSSAGMGSDDGQVRNHRETIARITSERMDVADKIMRMLQDYDLVSGAQMATYLMKSLQSIAGHPNRAAAMYRSSMSGITEPESLYISSGSGESRRKTKNRGGTLLELQTSKGRQRRDEPVLMRTPRGKYIPIQQDGDGIVVDMGYNKGRGKFGGKAKKKDKYEAGASGIANSVTSRHTASRSNSSVGSRRQDSRGSSDSSTRASISAGSNVVNQLKDNIQSDIPDGPMSRRGRAAMYRNYRALLVEEAGVAAELKDYTLQTNIGKGRGLRGGTGADLDMNGMPRRDASSATSTNSSALHPGSAPGSVSNRGSTDSTTLSSRKSSPPRPRGSE